jgi:hypothetical protein
VIYQVFVRAGWLVVLVIFRIFKTLINSSCATGMMVQLSGLV